MTDRRGDWYESRAEDDPDNRDRGHMTTPYTDEADGVYDWEAEGAFDEEDE